MARTTAKQVLYDVKEAYKSVSDDSDVITYGNIDDKIRRLSLPQGKITPNLSLKIYTDLCMPISAKLSSDINITTDRTKIHNPNTEK